MSGRFLKRIFSDSERKHFSWCCQYCNLHVQRHIIGIFFWKNFFYMISDLEWKFVGWFCQICSQHVQENILSETNFFWKNCHFDYFWILSKNLLAGSVKSPLNASGVFAWKKFPVFRIFLKQFSAALLKMLSTCPKEDFERSIFLRNFPSWQPELANHRTKKYILKERFFFHKLRFNEELYSILHQAKSFLWSF